MSRSQTPTDQKTPEEIVRDLEMAWNAGDGSHFIARIANNRFGDNTPFRDNFAISNPRK